MSLDADQVIDRRRLKRGLNLWRLLAIAALVLAVVAAYGRFDGEKLKSHVASLEIEGIIFSDRDRLEAIESVLDSDRIKALVLFIDSPGGTVVGGEELYRALRDLAEKKPVVAVMRETATSAAYMAALAADRLVAGEGTVTGSIGVLLQHADVTGLLDKLGVRPETLKSGPLKAQPNPLEPLSDEARAATQGVIQELHRMFVEMMANRRGMDAKRALELADGRIFTGRQALDAGLIDEVGGIKEARNWLAEERDVPRSLPLVEVEIKRDEGLWRILLEGALGKSLFSERLRLDGLVSVWHPGLY